MNPQKIARVTGVLFLITYITSIPAFFVFYPPVLDDPRYIVGGGADTSVSLGAFLELVLIIANIGTAVALWPVLKRVNEILALGYVTARVVECAFIAVGLLSLLTVVALRQAAAGADAGSLIAVGQSLVAIHGWTFVLGPGFVVGVGNGLILGYLMYRSGLVPRRMAMLGLVGGPLIIASGAAVVLGVIEAGGCGRPSLPSLSSFGSCHSASGSSSKDSIHLHWLPCLPPNLMMAFRRAFPNPPPSSLLTVVVPLPRVSAT